MIRAFDGQQVAPHTLCAQRFGEADGLRERDGLVLGAMDEQERRCVRVDVVQGAREPREGGALGQRPAEKDRRIVNGSSWFRRVERSAGPYQRMTAWIAVSPVPVSPAIAASWPPADSPSTAKRPGSIRSAGAWWRSQLDGRVDVGLLRGVGGLQRQPVVDVGDGVSSGHHALMELLVHGPHPTAGHPARRRGSRAPPETGRRPAARAGRGAAGGTRAGSRPHSWRG